MIIYYLYLMTFLIYFIMIIYYKKIKLKKNNILIKDLQIRQNSAMSSFIYLPSFQNIKEMELTKLYNFEKEIVSNCYSNKLSIINYVNKINGKKNKHFNKLSTEYQSDISVLVLYLKMLCKKIAYYVFTCIYEKHEALIRKRINIMQNNFQTKFEKLNDELQLSDKSYDIVTKRKIELKIFFTFYVVGIKHLLANHLYSFYENTYNNLIFFLYLLNLLPADSTLQQHPSQQQGTLNENNNLTSERKICYLKIDYRDMSSEYDLNDIIKKIRNTYSVDDDKKDLDIKEDNMNNMKKGVLYMAYYEDNTFFVNKLEKKISKYMSKLYTYMEKLLDVKKKETIKLISNDMKLHRKYYECKNE
ncbi:uncharacterized protein LOC113224088 [Piliocolobus tephrosceles]|uniref:uncharacterized protein LOC113224087 n=1 Tax=Piliocolobus tephrosceles TaxID=591936 RepID=UPI000E6B3379|nr:uncharacterized protein LOC113224087 [Piliocolobus tephrosceles]XP_026309159.1 uncharacterized protein LOC113224088 [Piliocolobus tephrosceles]